MKRQANLNSEFRTLPISELTESATNPRRHYNAAAMDDLTASVRSHGVLVPLVVRPVNQHFEVVAGARRLRAARAAGLAEVPVHVRQLNDDQALEVQCIENLQREDIHPLDEAQGYAIGWADELANHERELAVEAGARDPMDPDHEGEDGQEIY